MRNKIGGDWQFYQIEKKLSSIEDLIQELMRRIGNLECRGEVKFGQPNHISQSSLSFELKSKRTIDGKLVRDYMKEQEDNWDKLKDIKIDTPKSKPTPVIDDSDLHVDIHGNEYDPKKSSNEQHDFQEEEDDLPEVNDLYDIDEDDIATDGMGDEDSTRDVIMENLDWLNLMNEIKSGLDAFQRADYGQEEVREKVSGVILNRVKEWYKNK